MSRRTTVGVACLLAGLGTAACRAPRESAPNVKTSLGTLVRVEKRAAADGANPAIAPKPGEAACLLTFKGAITISDYQSGWEKRWPLVDSGGREFTPVLGGAPGENGQLSQDEFRLTGSVQGLAFKGSADVPGGVLVLAYVIPGDARQLALKDGPARHPLGID